jgi:hypothetical protein
MVQALDDSIRCADQADPSRRHWVKSIGLPHPLQVCSRSNSSEKISRLAPQLGHLQTNDFNDLCCSKPGQCWGVVMATSYFCGVSRGKPAATVDVLTNGADWLDNHPPAASFSQGYLIRGSLAWNWQSGV